MKTVWAAYYNDCVHESAYGLLSLHRTFEGASKAIDAHKAKHPNPHSWQDWDVQEIELND